MQSEQTRPPGAAPSRRGFVGVAAVLGTGLALGAGGCALNNPFSHAPTPAGRAVQDLSPDVAAAVLAVKSVHASLATIDGLLAVRPGLSSTFGPLQAMHHAHLAALRAAVPVGVGVGVGAGTVLAQRPLSRADALIALQTAEETHRATLVGLALGAGSGVFARLLGSMGASVSQHLVGLR